MAKYLFALLIFIFFLFPLTTIFAARNLTITGNKSTLFGDEEMVITASSSGFTSGETIYVKGAFYQEGSTNYFGYTKNGDVWIKNGETTTAQRTVTIGSWDQTIVVKSDFSDGGYKGEGEYKVKLGFYYTTSGGNLSSVNWSENILAVILNEPDPTPTSTPAPINTPAPTNAPTATPVPATATQAPTKVPTKTPTPTPKLTPTPTPMPEASASGEILGSEVMPTPAEAPRTTDRRPLIFILLAIGIGLALLATALVLQKQDILKRMFKRKEPPAES